MEITQLQIGNPLYGAMGDDAITALRERNAKRTKAAIKALGSRYVGHADRRVKRLADKPQ